MDYLRAVGDNCQLSYEDTAERR
ncbi:uncharacterized protein METZ01_LOCUS177692 [marine metagenome]|uniref:Uncharacterized protein n=1 Tax=marine metagenome TaxID=408172 RepID=A0A382CF62_9ZZZZ